jgi:hypothetical protein
MSPIPQKINNIEFNGITTGSLGIMCYPHYSLFTITFGVQDSNGSNSHGLLLLQNQAHQARTYQEQE